MSDFITDVQAMDDEIRDAFAPTDPTRTVKHGTATTIPGAEVTVKAIVSQGVEAENDQPGSGSAYVQLSARLADFATAPIEGDTIIIGDLWKYRIAVIDQDEAGWLTMRLQLIQKLQT